MFTTSTIMVNLLSLIVVLSTTTDIYITEAFVPSSLSSSSSSKKNQRNTNYNNDIRLTTVKTKRKTTTTELYGMNMFGSFGNFLNSDCHGRYYSVKTRKNNCPSLNMFGSFGNFLNSDCYGRYYNTISSGSSSNENNNNEDDYNTNDDNNDDNLAAGTYKLVDLPVQEMKRGGLRLFLLLYLMGQQGKEWKINQPDDYTIDFWYHDQSAVLSVELTSDEEDNDESSSSDNSVIIYRTGSKPSMQYIVQESIIVQGILDELEQCATDTTIERKNRLLLVDNEDLFNNIRTKTMAFE